MQNVELGWAHGARQTAEMLVVSEGGLRELFRRLLAGAGARTHVL